MNNILFSLYIWICYNLQMFLYYLVKSSDRFHKIKNVTNIYGHRQNLIQERHIFEYAKFGNTVFKIGDSRRGRQEPPFPYYWARRCGYYFPIDYAQKLLKATLSPKKNYYIEYPNIGNIFAHFCIIIVVKNSIFLKILLKLCPC